MSVLDDKTLWDTVFPAAKGATARSTFPPFWVPKVGDVLTGQIVKITTSPKSGKMIYTIATESEDGKSGRLLTLPMTTTVYAAIGTANEEYKGDVGVGSIVYIKYHGKKVSKKGFEYANFEVFISAREVAKQIMKDKGLVDKDGDMVGWTGEIDDDDVKRGEAARDEWQKRKAEGKGEETPTPEETPAKEEKPKKKEAKQKKVAEEDPIQDAKDEIEKMCVAFPRFPVATVEKILKSTGVEMEAEMFLAGMGIEIEDGNVLRPE